MNSDFLQDVNACNHIVSHAFKTYFLCFCTLLYEQKYEYLLTYSYQVLFESGNEGESCGFAIMRLPPKCLQMDQ